MKILRVIVLFVIVLFWQQFLLAQTDKPLRFAFYNVENFFDIQYDSTRVYNEFTPDGDQRWTATRYYAKRNNLYKTIASMGDGGPPALLGVCEVENEAVLRDLVSRTPLRTQSYQVVHYESNDRRGIDVALIYRKSLLTLLSSKPIRVNDPNDTSFKTRFILLATFVVQKPDKSPSKAIKSKASPNDTTMVSSAHSDKMHEDTIQSRAKQYDTISVFINHWPSRYGGQLESVERRFLAAQTLRRNVDSLLAIRPQAKIVIMGDLNDSPFDESILLHLRAFAPNKIKKPGDLVNLFTSDTDLGFKGTLKHLHSWQIFDQVIVTQALLNAEKGLRYRYKSARIFTAPFLFTDDERYLGKKLFRTYTGPTYIGGFADHLPVYIDLEWVE